MNRAMRRRFALGCRALGLVGVLAGCAPALPVPDTKIAVSNYLPGQTVHALAPPPQWWLIFGNAQLDALEQQGLSANPGIGEAVQTLLAAQQNADVANGAYLPQISLNPPASPAISRSSYPTGPNAYPPYTILSLTGSVTYDPGLFGARKYTFENGAALAAYQAAELDAARQSVAGNIAAAAITYAGFMAQIATTRNIIAAEQRLLALLQGEYADGAVPQLPVLQQQSSILAEQATLPPLQAQAAQQRDRLAILTGELPGDFAAPGISLASLTLPAHIPVELPSAYLADRPDIRAALAQVAAQNASLGIAVAHLYPDLTLSADGGWAAETFGVLFNSSSALWTLAGNLLTPLYEGGTLRAHKKAAQAQLAAAMLAYRGTVLSAFGQAADALAAEQASEVALRRATSSAQASAAAYKLATEEFQLGAIDNTTVFNAQEAAAQAALTEVQARTTLLLAIAQLQTAMAK